jgi:transposase
MYRVREILRLHYELHLSDRAIARAHGLHHSTVSDLLRRFESEGGPWPLPADMTDQALHQWLYRGHAGRPKRRPEPDWAQVHAELRRKGVTLQLLGQEYRAQHPDGYPYARFCDRYGRGTGMRSVGQTASAAIPG